MAAETATAVPHSIFSVEDCPPRERFDYWRHSIAAIFDVDAAQDVVCDFHATIDSHLIGPLMLARTRTRRQHWVRSSQTVARDGMDHYMVQLFEHGGQTVRTGEESRTMHAGQLIVCDLQRTLDNDTTDFQNLSVLVPRPLLASLLEWPDSVHGLVIGGAAPLGKALCEHMTTLKEAAGALATEDVQDVADATVTLIAACLNGAGRAARGKPVAPMPPVLQRIKRYILDHLHDPTLAPDTIAIRLGVSRSRLYEIFEPEGGVLTYLRVMRLKAAFDALRDPHQAGRPIEDIALAAGYRNSAMFCRAFKCMFDVTPGEVRGAAAMARPTFAPQPGVDRRYEQWLRDLRQATQRAAEGVAAGAFH